MASGGSTAGHGRQEQAARPMLVWATRARRTEVEEALQPLDRHRTVTGARIVHIDYVDKALLPRQLSRPTSQPPTMVGIHFFVRNKEALPCVRRYSWWFRPVSGGKVFFVKYRGPSGGSQLLGGGIIILRVIRRCFLACGRGPCGSQLSTSPCTSLF